MAVTGVGDILNNIRSSNGDAAVEIGRSDKNVERLQTGVFPFDIATGGGFPKGKVSIVFGAESSGKTNLALLAIAQAQREEPDKIGVFVDFENSFDEDWAEALGVNLDLLARLQPHNAEEGVDMVDAVLQAHDVSVVVVDSIAAMITNNEQTSTAEKASVGGASVPVSKMIKKITANLGILKKKDSYPTVILINQIRLKIGVMFGNPETIPGGNAQKFASGLTVRLYGKNEIDKNIHPSVPAWKVTTGKIQKHKVPIVGTDFEYKLAMIPNSEMGVGQAKWWNPMLNYLKSLGYLSSASNKYYFDKQEFKTQKELKDVFDEDLSYRQQWMQIIIKDLVNQVYGK